MIPTDALYHNMKGMKMRKITFVATSIVTALIMAGCGNVSVTVRDGNDPAVSAEEEAPEDGQKTEGKRNEVTGPYGQLSVKVPDDWECKICPLGNDDMSYGYYGFIVHPKDVKEGIISIFVATNFGVCGTGLKQEETVIAKKPARIGTYDNRKRWDFIVIGDEDPQIVATGGGCDSWTDEQWNRLQTMIESIEFDPSTVEGAIWQYTPESEDTDIGVSMDLSDITSMGATVHFYRFEVENAGELSYGDSYIIEKQDGKKWEELPVIAENAAFNDIAHIIPANETVEQKTDWEWLYGELSPGTYRIRKTVINKKDSGYTEHELIAQFLIAK